MKCPKCKEGEIIFKGCFSGRCENCNHVEYLDPYILKDRKTIDLKDWFKSDGWAQKNGHAIF